MTASAVEITLGTRVFAGTCALLQKGAKVLDESCEVQIKLAVAGPSEMVQAHFGRFQAYLNYLEEGWEINAPRIGYNSS